MYKKKKLLML